MYASSIGSALSNCSIMLTMIVQTNMTMEDAITMIVSGAKESEYRFPDSVVLTSSSTAELNGGLENEFTNEDDIEIMEMTITMPTIKTSK